MPFNLAQFYMVAARFTREGGDAVMNTFCFRENVLVEPTEAIRDRLDTFYYGALTGGQEPIGALFAHSITGLTYYMRRADAPRGTPGVELPSETFVRSSASQQQLPPDLCVAISYRGEPPATASRRGRIYFGPLQSQAWNGANGRIQPAVRGRFAEAARMLASASQANPVRWCVASRTLNAAAEITNGYVDEHFDTQRRRDPGAEVFGRIPSTWQVAPEAAG